MSELLLGIDIGTYSSKGVLTDAAGTVLRSHVVEHTMNIPQPGWAEHDADGVWWADTVAICRTLLDDSPYGGEDVAGVAVSAIGPCLVPLDEEDRPLRPGILYGVDTRATAEIRELNELWGKETIFSFSDMTLSSQAVGPKILWLRRNEPEVWARTAHLTTASSYIVLRLTGEKRIDLHTAGHYMPLMNVQTGNWSARFAEPLVNLELLPKPGWSDEKAGEVTDRAASETGLKAGTPVAIGAVDALSEAISVAVVRPGDLMIMYGSTTFFILIQDTPTPDPRMWTIRGAFNGQFNLAAGMATTGSLTRWFRDELARDLTETRAYERLFATVDEIEAGAGGLLILPYFSGERTPINDPQARGVVVGLTLAHTREHLFRAVLESVAYGIRHNIETFEAIGSDVKRIVAVGGGAQSKTWLQIVSDVAGVEQIVPALTIGASYGDAFLAGLAAGLLVRNDISHWVKPDYTVAPRRENRAIYDALYRSYLNLYSATRDIIHALP